MITKSVKLPVLVVSLFLIAQLSVPIRSYNYQPAVTSNNSIAERLSLIKDGEIITVAGGDTLGDGGRAVNATLLIPTRVATDVSGNIFLVDDGHARIRRIDAATGIITTVAGNGKEGFSGDGGPAVNASFNLNGGAIGSSGAIIIDRDGNLWIADTFNHRVRRVDARTNIIDTVAGNGENASRGDGGPARLASLSEPAAIALDRAGTLYIAEAAGSRIRRVDAHTGVITTIAGNGQQGLSPDGIPAVNASLALSNFNSMVIDDAGNILFTEFNRVRRVDVATNIITTVAGIGGDALRETGDGGLATSATLVGSSGLAFDNDGNLLIGTQTRVRRVDARTGIISTIAGGDRYEFGGDGGPAINASFQGQLDIAVDSAGNIFIADRFNSRVRRIDGQQAIINTITGGSFGDGNPALLATLLDPADLAFDTAGNLFLIDSRHDLVRRIDAATGVITSVARGFFYPQGLALDAEGNIYFAGTCEQQIFTVDAGANRRRVVAGNGFSEDEDCPNSIYQLVVRSSGTFSGDNGPALRAGLDEPQGVAVDRAKNIYIADSLNGRIRRVDARTGVITTLIDAAVPRALTFDSAGRLLFTELASHRIKRLDVNTGQVETVAGNGFISNIDIGVGDFKGDGGPATQASLNAPTAIAIDRLGNIFVADRLNTRVRRIDARTGMINTVAGGRFANEDADIGDQTPALSALVRFPGGVAVDGAGNLFIADAGNRRVRVVKGVADRSVMILKADMGARRLTISGFGFHAGELRVEINDKDVTTRISNGNDGQLALKGNLKKLNLRPGINRIKVIAGGDASNIFELLL